MLKISDISISKFTLTWTNEGKVKSVPPYMTHSKELMQKILNEFSKAATERNSSKRVL